MKLSSAPYGIHWFRRDLRVAGNPALRRSWKEHQGRVLGLFCFDSRFLARSDFSHDRFGFFLKTLSELRDELQEQGGDLLVLDQSPQQAFDFIFESLKKNRLSLPAAISWNRDYEPFARTRDAEIKDILESKGVQIWTEKDHLVFEPEELYKPGQKGSFYQVYSPFAKRWFEQLSSSEVQKKIDLQKEGLKYLAERSRGRVGHPLFCLKWKDLYDSAAVPKDHLMEYVELNSKKTRVKIPDAGSLEAFRILQSFRDRMEDYGSQRDIPSVSGTSGLSIFLKNGSITSWQIIAALGLGKTRYTSESGMSRFLKEIVWREFYYHILYHHPRVENEAFLLQYKDIAWENDKSLFAAWKEGRTGYPIVDAGMRQLATTGWMHNRVRMIVASFLTKDLLIDWRWGEKYFMERLLDGDLAPNNGGWQWAASTGCDPQPYFRIFNPELQSKRFDPEGKYIRKYVPELKNLSDREIHSPSELEAAAAGYALPVVHHASRKTKALMLYTRSKVDPDKSQK